MAQVVIASGGQWGVTEGRGIRCLKPLNVCSLCRVPQPASFCGVTLLPPCSNRRNLGLEQPRSSSYSSQDNVSWMLVWGLAPLLPPLLRWPKEHPHRTGSHRPGSMSPHACPPGFLHSFDSIHGRTQVPKGRWSPQLLERKSELISHLGCALSCQDLSSLMCCPGSC